MKIELENSFEGAVLYSAINRVIVQGQELLNSKEVGEGTPEMRFNKQGFRELETLIDISEALEKELKKEDS